MISKRVSFLLLILFVFVSNTYAYLDPGTMTYVFQALIAIVVGSMVAIRTSWTTIKSFFIKLFTRESKVD